MVLIKFAPLMYRGFVLFILLISLLPFKNRYFEIAGRELSYGEVFVFIVMLLLIPMILKKNLKTKPSFRAVKYLYFIIFYALFSMMWASYDVDDWYIFYQLALTFFAITVSYLMAKITNDKYIDYHKLISNFSFVLSLVYFVYILQHDDSRVGGFLGGAAIIGVIMIPAIAVHFHNLAHRTRLITSSIGFIVTALAIFRTESRVALVMLILFIAVTLLRKPSIKRVFLFIFMSLIFIALFYQSISTDRYDRIFIDSARNIIFDTAMNWWTHSIQSFIFGNGYGSIWAWNAYDVGEFYWWQTPFQPTEYGYVMFHAHSVFSQLIAELGIIGLLPFLVFIYLILKETIKSLRDKNEFKTNILVGVVCSMPTLHTDLLFFRNWEISIVWLFFVFTALNYEPRETANNAENTSTQKGTNTQKERRI